MILTIHLMSVVEDFRDSVRRSISERILSRFRLVGIRGVEYRCFAQSANSSFSFIFARVVFEVWSDACFFDILRVVWNWSKGVSASRIRWIGRRGIANRSRICAAM